MALCPYNTDSVTQRFNREGMIPLKHILLAALQTCYCLGNYGARVPAANGDLSTEADVMKHTRENRLPANLFPGPTACWSLASRQSLDSVVFCLEWQWPFHNAPCIPHQTLSAPAGSRTTVFLWDSNVPQ